MMYFIEKIGLCKFKAKAPAIQVKIGEKLKFLKTPVQHIMMKKKAIKLHPKK